MPSRRYDPAARSAVNSSMPRIRYLVVVFFFSSGPEELAVSICNGSALHRRAELPLMPGKLSVLLDTNARRGVTSRWHLLLKLSITYRELAVISRHMCTLSSEELSSRSFSLSLYLSLLLPVSATRAHPWLLNRCIKGWLL